MYLSVCREYAVSIPVALAVFVPLAGMLAVFVPLAGMLGGCSSRVLAGDAGGRAGNQILSIQK